MYIDRDEAEKALKEGKRVQFHWQGKTVEITLKTTFADLRWELMARNKLLVSHVTNGRYSVI